MRISPDCELSNVHQFSTYKSGPFGHPPYGLRAMQLWISKKNARFLKVRIKLMKMKKNTNENRIYLNMNNIFQFVMNKTDPAGTSEADKREISFPVTDI